MASGRVVVHFELPPEELWRHVVDVEAAPTWVPGLIEVERLTKGDVAVGTRLRQLASFAGATLESRLEVTRCEAPHAFAQTGEGGPARFTASFHLEPEDGGTRLTHDWSVELEGSMRMLEPMVAGWVRAQAESACENLGRVARGELSAETE